jgi:1,4-alpha-glucan branching enzyme
MKKHVHGLMFGSLRPRNAIYAPCFTPAGPAAFGRDRESAKQVWSQRKGYPGDPAYRDFYRGIGYDLDLEYLRPFLPPDGSRRFTGIKYHRITGPIPNKEI